MRNAFHQLLVMGEGVASEMLKGWSQAQEQAEEGKQIADI